MTSPIRPEIYDKVWVCSLDDRVRPAHRRAHGQRAPFSGTFDVGGEDLRYPGDPLGTPENTYNCRCHVRIEQRGSLTADGGFVAPSEQEYAMATLTTDVVNAEDLEPDVDGESYRTFTDAVVAILGESSSDGRVLAADIDLAFRAFPLPLMWMKQNVEGHLQSYTVGVIEDARAQDDKVLASGYLLNSAEADEAAGQVAHGVTGPSVDLAGAEWHYTDENGVELEGDELWERVEAGSPVLMRVTRAELIGTTLCAMPAFGATALSLNTDRESREVAIVASAAAEFRPRVYDHRLFEDPHLSGPTLPTVGDDGRVYGHLAVFGQCHRSIQTECVLVPRSPTGYSHFHTSPALCLDDGSRLPVGRLTVGTGHADPRLGAAPATAHYDNTGSCFALVRVGEDRHGVWFSGVVAPWATDDQIEQGMSSPLSGDWRDFGQGLELVAALAVNTPGFAARGRDDEQGRPVALVASLGPPPNTRRGGMNMTRSELKSILVEAAQETLRLKKQEDDEAERNIARHMALARAAEHTRPPTPKEQVEKILARLA